jgi:hypothetical protein
VNIKKIFVSIILLSSTTSLIFVQSQQPASAGFLDDVNDFLKGMEIGADLVNEIERSTNPDGTVNLGNTVRATNRAVNRVREATSDSSESVMESPQQNYQSPTEEYSDPESSQDEEMSDESAE